MEFLLEYNLTNEDITIIKNNNYEEVLNIILYNKNNVCEIIEYLLSIGIETSTLAQMLSDRLDLFMRSKNDLIEKFDKFNVDNLVTIINDDIANLKFI